MSLVIASATTSGQVAEVRALFQEYWDSFGFTPCFQGFADELAALPGAYSPPGGRLLLAAFGGKPAGCAAFRRFDNLRCEAKRLYVRPEFRGHGIGRALMDQLISAARAAGYSEILGDTMPVMGQAIAMYDRMGFERIDPYSENATAGAIFIRLRL